MMSFSRFASGSSSMASSSSATQQAVAKKLAELLTSPDNQSCADCSARLLDSVWASTTVGAFLCIHCAGAHRKLGVQLSRVKSLQLDSWTEDELLAMRGGNQRVSGVYAKFQSQWAAVDSSSLLLPDAVNTTREEFARAKYEELRFTKPPVSEVSTDAGNEEKGDDSPERPEDSPTQTRAATRPSEPSTSSHSPSKARGAKQIKPGSVVEVTKRFLNYFVVIGRGALAPNQSIDKSKSPTDIRFVPTIVDSFPESFPESPMPSHIAEFAFPEGFALSPTYAPPELFSFVLTNVSGVKIYASALRFYEELHPLEVISLLAPSASRPRHRRRPSAELQDGLGGNNSSNQSSELPQWIRDLSGSALNAPGAVFCPKCIAVTSHYPYFSAFRHFLQQIYRITLSDSPMPVERFIANFVSEIPLPPPGQIQVQLTLPDRSLIISRPPKNDLPLVDFSFRPLFQVLDVSNILQVFSCVTLEQKVVLCSKHVALLTPVAEALLALLLPLSWQGAYIPVLPTCLLDVIDAPVPFIVGTHSDCLKQSAGRTAGVVFVDLDHNRVIPAVDESGATTAIPKLPERQSYKLRAKLAEHANIFDPFAAGVSKIDMAYPSDEHLQPIGNFASDQGQTVPLVKSISESSLSETLNSIYSKGKMRRGRKPSNAFGSPSPSSSAVSTSPFARGSFTVAAPSSSASTLHSSTLTPAEDACSGLTDSRFNESDGFSTQEVRKAFLRFFVTLLKKYAHYLKTPSAQPKHGAESLFDGDAFVRDNFDFVSRPFVAQLIGTQMFDRFIEDRVCNPQLPEVLFFDQSINQKLNRGLTIGKRKYDCSFLDDRADDVKETFIAPPPSNIGLPDNGTIYSYKAFPRLKKALFGNVRKPRELFTSREQQRNVSQVDFHRHIFALSKRPNGSNPSWETTRRLIVDLQTRFRMYSARKKFLEMKRAVVLIQRWAIARIKGKAARQTYLELRHGAIVVQKTYRMHRIKTQYRVQQAALYTLQYAAKGFVVRVRLLRTLRGVRRLQAQWRSRFHKHSYKYLKHQVVRLQSRIRGFLCRQHTRRWQAELFEGVRGRTYELWDKCGVPLLYRSKFWLTFDSPDFFNLGVYLEEEGRLKGYFLKTQDAQDAYEYSLPTPTSGKKGAEFRRPVLPSSIKSLVRPKKREAQRSIADIAMLRVDEERTQLYLALKRNTTPSVRLAFYGQLAIDASAKKKKRKLASILWTKYEFVNASAEVVVTVTASSDRLHILPAQIDRHKQLRIREDLAFTVNAALGSISRSSTAGSKQSRAGHTQLESKREVAKQQHQLRALASQNHRLTDELAAAKKEMSRLQMELQLLQNPQQLRRVQSEKSAGELPRE